MIRHIIFDLDGVLVETKEIHRQIFTHACQENGITYTEEYHHEYLCGLPTDKKLEKLNVPEKVAKKIIKLKQDLTADRLNDLPKDLELSNVLLQLQDAGMKLTCASNTVINSLVIVLHRLGIIDHFEYFVSSSDVKNPKPSPEMYYRCMTSVGLWIPETLVIEDSKVGMEAIIRGGCHGLMVKNRANVTFDRIMQKCSMC